MMRGFVFGMAYVLGLGMTTVQVQVQAQTQTQTSEPVQALSQALQIPEVMAVLAEEGVAGAAEMLAEPGAVNPVWQGTVAQIYDTAKMEQAFLAALDTALAPHPDAVAKATAFFNSGLGQRALRLELEARRVLADSDVEATARLAYDSLAKENPDRQTQLDAFVVANDLIEANVFAALNANLAFLRGVAAESGDKMKMSEADMVAQVWSGEADVRAKTVSWLFPFLNLAYQPLTDTELQTYVDFSETPAGQQVNAALFRAYDRMFDGLSRDLGRAYARQMVGQDI